MMMIAVLQQPGTGQIHRQPQHGRADRLVVTDRQRMQEALDRMPQHQHRHRHQQQGTGIAPQNLDLPGTKGEAPVMAVARRHPVGKHRQPQRQRVRTHVPSIRQQRHRVEQPAPHDLRQHHHQRQPHHPARAALCHRIALPEHLGMPAVPREPVDLHRTHLVVTSSHQEDARYYTPV